MSENVKIALANINNQVGDFFDNARLVAEAAKEMDRLGVTIGVFQEQVFSGYPSEDLVHFPTFVDGQLEAFMKFVESTAGKCPLYIPGVTIPFEGHKFNCAALVYDGEIWGLVPKEKLPNYGIFHEWRTTTPGFAGLNEVVKLSDKFRKIPFGDLIFEHPDFRLALDICEDVWSEDGPMNRRAYDVDIVANISASPFRDGVVETRREMIATRSGDRNVVLIYCNQYGGQDALTFDGGGFIFQNGRKILEAPRWVSGFSTCVVDLSTTRRIRSENTTWRTDWTQNRQSSSAKVIHIPFRLKSTYSEMEEPKVISGNPFVPAKVQVENPEVAYFEDLLSAMVTGVEGYFEKNGFWKRIGIALSGGNDSFIALYVSWLYAKKKFGNNRKMIRDFIYCISMPSRFNSSSTRSIAQIASKEMGVTFMEDPIQEEVDMRVERIERLTKREIRPLTLENVQARNRGSFMWDLAAEFNFLWLHTGNLTENAVGYTTMGGDIMGMYSPIGDLPKSVIIRLRDYLATKHPKWKSLAMLCETKASAELAENQEDERELAPFEVLDTMLYFVAGEKFGPLKVYKRLRDKYTDDDLLTLAPWFEPGMLKAWVKRFFYRFFGSEFKRMQMPQAVHLGAIDLDRDRSLHLPVVASLAWLQADFDEIDKLPD